MIPAEKMKSTGREVRLSRLVHVSKFTREQGFETRLTVELGSFG